MHRRIVVFYSNDVLSYSCALNAPLIPGQAEERRSRGNTLEFHSRTNHISNVNIGPSWERALDRGAADLSASDSLTNDVKLILSFHSSILGAREFSQLPDFS